MQNGMAAQPLRVGISGAGMGGLAAAIALARAGAHVTILEAASELGEIGAGIQMFPNVSRLLIRWGVDEIIGDNLVLAGEVSSFGPNGDADLIAHTHGDVVKKQTGFPWWVVRRDHLHAGLSESARRHGVNMIVNARISEIDDSEPHIVKVKTTKGVGYEFDLLVGADGVKSFVRKHLFPNVEPKAVSRVAAYRGILDHEEVFRKIPEARLLLRENSVNDYVAAHGYILFYPLSGGRELNVVTAFRPDHLVQTLEDVPIDTFRDMYKGFAPLAQKIINLVHETKQWPLLVLPKLKTWSNHHKTIVLLGDAAHAMQNHMAQGAATAMEDGAFLGRVVSEVVRSGGHISHSGGGKSEGSASRMSIADAISIYESARIPRCWTKQQSALIQGEVLMAGEPHQLRQRERASRAEVDAVYANPVKPAHPVDSLKPVKSVNGSNAKNAENGVVVGREAEHRSWQMWCCPESVPGILNYDAEGDADWGVCRFLQERGESRGEVDETMVSKGLREKWWGYAGGQEEAGS